VLTGIVTRTASGSSCDDWLRLQEHRITAGSVTGPLLECCGSVISKCANPQCTATFRFLHDGKLFQFEMKLFDELLIAPSTASHNDKPMRKIECFWLCDSCASTMTIVCEAQTHRIAIVPLQEIFEKGVVQTALPFANR